MGNDVSAAFATCQQALLAEPGLAALTGALLAVSPQAGLTNRVYRLAAEKGEFVLRLPRLENAGEIDRMAEQDNLLIASALGVGVAPLWIDAASGFLLLPALAAPGPVGPEELGTLVGRLHGSGASFVSSRSLIDYVGLCFEAIADMESLACIVSGLSAACLDQLKALPAAASVPCHFDPSPGNLVRDDGRLHLIDFEYAAQSAAAWDLAYGALEFGYSEDEEARFLRAYSGYAPLPTPLEIAVHKLACDTVSVLWALRQHRLGSGAADFLAIANKRKGRAMERLRSLSGG